MSERSFRQRKREPQSFQVTEKLYNIKTVSPCNTDILSAIESAESIIFGDPWSLRSLTDACADDTYSIIIAEANGKLAGYLISSHVADESELLRIAVLPEHRRRGIAKLLATHYTGKSCRHGITRFFLEVRRSNSAAQALYESLGYRHCGVRKAYYARPVEDAILMMRES